MGFKVNINKTVEGYEKKDYFYTIKKQAYLNGRKVMVEEKLADEYYITYTLYCYLDHDTYVAGGKPYDEEKDKELIVTLAEYEADGMNPYKLVYNYEKSLYENESDTTDII